MEHLHCLTLDIPRSTRVFCDSCDDQLRLATAAEAEYVHANGIENFDGCAVFTNSVIIVPLNFSIPGA